MTALSALQRSRAGGASKGRTCKATLVADAPPTTENVHLTERGTPVEEAIEPQEDARDRIRLGHAETARLGVGTISWNATTEGEEAALRALVAQASQHGVLFDTAERYGTELGPPFDRWPFAEPGRCERILGEAFGSNRDCASTPFVATKFTPTPWRNTTEAIVDACKASLKRLNVESMDLYQIHHPDIVQPLKAFGIEDRNDEALWEGLAECVKQGLTRSVGVSNYGPTLVSRAQEALGRHGVDLASNQINFSLLYRRQGAMKTVEMCKRSGVAVLAYWPLAMGLLTGAAELQVGGLRSRDLNQYLKGGGPIPPGGIQPLLEVVRRIAVRRARSCSQVALNWVICKGAVPIPGARTSHRFEEYFGALGWRLTDEEVGALDEAAEALPFDFEGAGFRISNGKFVGYGIERWTLD